MYLVQTLTYTHRFSLLVVWFSQVGAGRGVPVGDVGVGGSGCGGGEQRRGRRKIRTGRARAGRGWSGRRLQRLPVGADGGGGQQRVRASGADRGKRRGRGGGHGARARWRCGVFSATAGACDVVGGRIFELYFLSEIYVSGGGGGGLKKKPLWGICRKFWLWYWVATPVLQCAVPNDALQTSAHCSPQPESATLSNERVLLSVPLLLAPPPSVACFLRSCCPPANHSRRGCRTGGPATP